MAFDYVSISNDAAGLIDIFGADVSFSGNTSRGVRTRFSQNQIDGTNIRADDILVILDNSNRPVVGDIMSMGGVVLGRVFAVEEVAPAGVVIVYRCGVRK